MEDRSDSSEQHLQPAEAVRLAVLAEALRLREAGQPLPAMSEMASRYPGFEAVVREELDNAGTGAFASEPPRRIGGYRLREPLALGGQGVVWLAHDETLQRDVALKMLPLAALGDEAALARFRSEAALAARIEHPGICPVWDAGLADGMAWIAMRPVPGKTLSSRFAAWTEPLGSVERDPFLRLVCRLLDALQAAHDAGIVHRDIKPANVIVTDGELPVVLDFGLAKEPGADGPTRTGDSVGTPGYASPEQLRGETVDARADVFAVGVLCYEGLLGRRPFQAATRAGVERAVLDAEPALAGLPRDLRAVLETALAKSPAQRYASAAAFRTDLECFVARRSVSVRRAGLIRRFGRAVRREPVVAGAVLAVVGAAVVATVVSMRSRWGAERAAEQAAAVALAAEAEQLAGSRPDLALSLATAAFQAEPTPRTRSALAAVLDRTTAVRAQRGDRLAGTASAWLGSASTLFVLRPDGVMCHDVAAGTHRFVPLPASPLCVVAAPSRAGALLGLEDGSLQLVSSAADVAVATLVAAEPGAAAVTALDVASAAASDRHGEIVYGTGDGELVWLDAAGAEAGRCSFGSAVGFVRCGLVGGATLVLSRTGEYRLLDRDRSLLRRWQMAGSGFFPALVLDEGRRVVTATSSRSMAGGAGALRIDHVQRDEVTTLPLFDVPIARLVAESRGSRVLASDLHGNLASVDVVSQQVDRLRPVDARLSAGALSADSEEWLVGLSSGAVRAVGSPRSGGIELRGHQFRVERVQALHLEKLGLPAGAGLLSWSGLGELLIHRQRPLPDLLAGEGALVATAAELSPAGDLVAIVRPDLARIEAADPQSSRDGAPAGGISRSATHAPFREALFSPDGKTVALCSVDGGVQFVATRDGSLIRSVDGQGGGRNQSFAASWIAGGRLIVGGSGRALSVLAPDREDVVRVELPAAAPQVLQRLVDARVVALCLDGSLLELDVSTEPVAVRLLAKRVHQIATDPARRLLAFCQEQRLVVLEDGVETPRLEQRPELVITSLALVGGANGSPRLLVGDADGGLHAVALDTGTWQRFGRHAAPVYRFAANRAGTRIASAARDGSVQVHRGDGQLLFELPARPPFPTALQFGLDDRLLLVGGSARRVSLWPTHDDQLLELARRGAAEPLESVALDRWRALVDGLSTAADSQTQGVAQSQSTAR